MKAINLDFELPPPPHDLVIRERIRRLWFKLEIICDICSPKNDTRSIYGTVYVHTFDLQVLIHYDQEGVEERGAPEGLCTLCRP